jgi:protein LSM12
MLTLAISIRITTSAPTSTTLEGILFTADPITNLLALQTTTLPPSTSNPSFPSGAYRIVPISAIQSFQLVSLPPTDSTKLDISPLHIPSLHQRHTNNITQLQSALASKGPPGTTPLFQSIYDGLARLLPTKWQPGGTSILVSDSMIIDRPYLPANVRLVEGMKGRVGEVERIRKVLDMERSKAAMRGAKDVLDGREVAAAKKGGGGGEARKGG